MSIDKKYIRFIDSNYNTLFYVPDKGEVRTRSYDGYNSVHRCEYIDETHFRFGSSVYHICEFAEIMERNGCTYEPVKEIGDLDFYSKRYYDRNNVDEFGAPIPYHQLLSVVTDRNTGNEVKVEYGYCLKPAEPEKAFCKVTFPERWTGGTPEFVFSGSIEELCEDEKVCGRIHRIVEAIIDEFPHELGDVLRDAEARSVQDGNETSDKCREALTL